MLSIAAKVFLAPLEVWAAVFQKRKLPRSAWIGIVTFGCLVFGWMTYAGLNFANEQRLSTVRYEAIQAVDANDFERAVELFSSLQRDNVQLLPSEQFRYAQSLARTGDGNRANELLNNLAPAPGLHEGYPAAHRFAAISLVRASQLPFSAETQRLLKWHLDCGSRGAGDEGSGLRSLLENDASNVSSLLSLTNDSAERESDSRSSDFLPEFYYAKARYLESTKQYDAAIEPMEIAARHWPKLYLPLAKLCGRVGKQHLKNDSLKKAERFLQRRLVEDDSDNQSRMELARVYLKLEQPDLAEQQLLRGAKLAPQIFRPQLSAFFLDRLRMLPAAASTEERLSVLNQAIQFDPQNIAVYENVIQLYRGLDGNGRLLVWELLKQTAADDLNDPLPRFAMGILHRLEQRFPESKVQIQAAFQRLDPDQPGFAAIANNLAWLLAHDQQPDLSQAHRLAQMAVDHHPHAGGLRDTLATILMKEGNWKEALKEFQKALPSVRDKSAVHLKMAKIYEVLEQPQLANLHRNRASAK